MGRDCPEPLRPMSSSPTVPGHETNFAWSRHESTGFKRQTSTPKHDSSAFCSFLHQIAKSSFQVSHYVVHDWSLELDRVAASSSIRAEGIVSEQGVHGLQHQFACQQESDPGQDQARCEVEETSDVPAIDERRDQSACETIGTAGNGRYRDETRDKLHSHWQRLVRLAEGGRYQEQLQIRQRVQPDDAEGTAQAGEARFSRSRPHDDRCFRYQPCPQREKCERGYSHDAQPRQRGPHRGPE